MRPLGAAASTSPFAAELLAGPRREGVAVGTGYALFGDLVLALTPPGALRMPNGLETELVLEAGEPVTAGEGMLAATGGAVRPGPLWDSRPHPRVRLSASPRLHVEPEELAGRGPGLTPLGDDVLVGYFAGLALAGHDVRAAAAAAAARTTALSATLLRLAARGRLPEAAHRLLEDGELGPLLGFGATSGSGIAVGLGLAGDAVPADGTAVALNLPLPDGPTRFELVVAVSRARRAPLPLLETEGRAYACTSSRS